MMNKDINFKKFCEEHKFNVNHSVRGFLSHFKVETFIDNDTAELLIKCSSSIGKNGDLLTVVNEVIKKAAQDRYNARLVPKLAKHPPEYYHSISLIQIALDL